MKIPESSCLVLSSVNQHPFSRVMAPWTLNEKKFQVIKVFELDLFPIILFAQIAILWRHCYYTSIIHAILNYDCLLRWPAFVSLKVWCIIGLKCIEIWSSIIAIRVFFLKCPPVDCVSVWFKKNPLLSTWSTMEDWCN